MEIIFRTVISILLLFVITRIMGTKQISHLTIFDYIIGITIGTVAGAFALDTRISLPNGILVLVIMGIISILVSYLSIHSITMRRLLGSTPTIFIENGKILEKNLKKERFNVNDLMEELRIRGVFNPADVEFAILETNGQVSVELKSQKRPLTPGDIHLSTGYEGLSANIIVDGKVMKDNLKMVNLDSEWLQRELEKRNIPSSKDVLLASLDTKGKLFIDLKDRDNERKSILG